MSDCKIGITLISIDFSLVGCKNQNPVLDFLCDLIYLTITTIGDGHYPI